MRKRIGVSELDTIWGWINHRYIMGDKITQRFKTPVN